MQLFLKFKDFRLKRLYEEERVRQFCLNIKYFKYFAAFVILIEVFFIVFEYSMGFSVLASSESVFSFALRLTLVAVESLVLLLYFIQVHKKNKIPSDVLEISFTLLFTTSYIVSSHIVLTFLQNDQASKEMTVTFALKVGTEFLWRYAFITFISKLWLSQVLNIILSLTWVLAWVIVENQALLVAQVAFNIVVWLFVLGFSEKVKRTSFLKSQDLHDKEHIYKNIFDTVPEYIFVIDKESKVRHVNKYARDVMGGDIRSLEKLKDLKWRKNISRRKVERLDSSPFTSKRTKGLIALKESPSEMTSHALESVGTFVDIHKLFKQNLFDVLGENAAVYDCKYVDETNYQQRSFELRVASIRNKLERFLLVTMKDTTERDMIVALESENIIYRDNLLESFSHELRTPLNGTIAFMEQMMDEEDISSQIKDKYVVPALSSARLLLFQIQDILDYSQLLLDHFDLSLHLKKFSETVWDCLNLFEPKFQEKKLKYSVNIAADVPTCVYTDHQRLSQILINILNNAVRFTMSGKIWMAVESIDTRTLRITVGDTGIGMDEDTQTRLRCHLSSGMLKGKVSTFSSGMGMGLMIANRLAKKLSPTEESGIEFYSVVAEGSKFSFLVNNRIDEASLDDIDVMLSDVFEFDHKRRPSKQMSHLNIDKLIIPSRNRESNVGLLQTAFEKPSILIVDDDAFNIIALETICHSQGIKTERAYHGKEAIEKLILRNGTDHQGNEAPYKIVLMDCNMPVMDGFEATETIKKMIKRGEIDDVKVIAVTAYVGESDVKRCFMSGMDEVLHKPVFKKTLIETLQKYGIA